MNTNISKLEAAVVTSNTSRTTQLLELMKKGDDAFNSRNLAGMKAVHHLDMIARYRER